MIEVIEPVSEEENYIPEIVICATDREKNDNTNDEISVKTDPSTISINSQHHGNVNDGYEENEESVPDQTQDAVSVNIDVGVDNLIEKPNEIVITSVFAAE